MSNERFEKYYQAQQILPAAEWDSFMQALRQPLPSTFRIAGNRQMKDVLNEAIKNTFVPQLEAGSFDGEPLPVPRPITWYPQGLAWHLNVPRKELRRSPEYKRFHSFLVYETEVGNISRQEAVSMIPPLFLDVRPCHAVVDLCAAPGSKTSQLLEAMDPPSGILIANDVDHKRAQLLVHTSARLPSPALMVTNLDASVFPSLKYEDKPLRYDRILADVPCSGDGTIRKNVGIWRSWSPMEGNGLHALQLRILQRSMRMVKSDASSVQDKPRIVYSTCSLNPVENEAVIAAALNTVPGFELVDVSKTLPNLARRSGLTTWLPAINRDADMPYASYEDYCTSLTSSITLADGSTDSPNIEGREKDESNKHKGKGIAKGRGREGVVRNRMLATHWPPANVAELGLERCMRIYPHLQDTGGFFVAVLERTNSPACNAARPKTEGKRPILSEDVSTNGENVGPVEGPVTKKARLIKDVVSRTDGMDGTSQQKEVYAEEPSGETGGTFKENPFTFISADEPSLVSCIEKLNLAPAFPRANLYVRNPEGTPVRSLYLVNDVVKTVMSQTDYAKIRLVSAGVKLFGRSELATAKGPLSAQHESQESAKTQFRVLSEGLLALLPYLDQESLIDGDAKAMRIFLETYYPLCSSFEQPFKSSIENKVLGSHIVRFRSGEYGSTSLSHDLFLPLWKSDVSVSLMIDKKAKSALSLRLFGEDITVAGRQALKQLDEKKAKKGAQAILVDEGPGTGVEDTEDADEMDDAADASVTHTTNDL
ncbi:S-adenosyl-L-methionine-dependent methyltransferase [Phellopilus nigrolimitatus]|nr:S-adenosyl-L-methionine-dependent methyltransferase [Phellopilus nigrolimitatus]